ncbi:hypothetical protein D3C76_1050370 [compost metagenome]
MLAQAPVHQVGQQAVEAHEKALRPAQVQVAAVAGNGVDNSRGDGLRVVDAGFECVIQGLRRRAVHARAGGARCDVQHTDPGIRQLPAQGFGKPAQCEFAGAITGVTGVANRAVGGTDVYHHGAVGLLEQWQQGFGQANRRADVHRQHRADFAVIELFEHGEVVDPGRIDQKVYPAQDFGGGQHLAPVGLQCQVGAHPEQPVPIAFEQGLQRLPMSGHGQHRGATGAQGGGDRQANAAAGTGQYHASLRQAHAGSPRRVAGHGTCRRKAGKPLWRRE